MQQKVPKKYRVFGCIIDKNSEKGVAGLRVEAWDKDLICDDLVGSTLTGKQGIFQIEFDDSYFKELFLDREPDLFFKVFRKREFLISTERAILWNFKSQKKKIVIEIEEQQPRPPVYPDPRQYPDVLPHDPVNTGKRFFPPGPGAWKENIQDYWRELQERKGPDAPRIPRLRPYLECSNNFFPKFFQLAVGEAGELSLTVTNNGDFTSWTCYVELYTGPGLGRALSLHELHGRKIVTLQHGESREIALPFVRFPGEGRIVGVCYDPVLDPKDFTVVEQPNRHITIEFIIL